MSHGHLFHLTKRFPALVWVLPSTAVAVAAACYDALTGSGFWASFASLTIALTFALAALAAELGMPGARTRVYGSAAATAGAVVALAAVHGGGTPAVVWTGALVTVAGVAAIVGDGCSGARPGRDAARLAISTSATVSLFLISPIVAYVTGT